MPTVYLSGPISGETFDGARGWREWVEARLAPGIVAVSPMRGKEELRSRLGPDGVLGMHHSYQEVLNCSAQAITQRDRFDCMNADCVLVNLLGAKRVSIGTMIELGWADAARRPVVLVWHDSLDNLHSHPIVEGIAGWQLWSLETAVGVVNTLLGPLAACQRSRTVYKEHFLVPTGSMKLPERIPSGTI